MSSHLSDDPRVLDYVYGELDADQKKRFEHDMQNDPTLVLLRGPLSNPGHALFSAFWGLALSRAKAMAPRERPKSRTAMSWKPGINSKFRMMPQSHSVTTHAPIRGLSATNTPAAISTTPTASMNE